MIKVWTNVTLDETGVPVESTEIGLEWHVLTYSTLSVNMSDNYIVHTLRDATTRIVHDPTPLYPVSGNFTVSYSEINSQGGSPHQRYLGPMLYRAYRLKYPIVIFNQGAIGEGRKCFLGYLTSPLDERLSGAATFTVTEPMNTMQGGFQRDFRFNLAIMLDGVYDDFNDLTDPGLIEWYER